MTFSETLCSILKADAQLSDAGTLGAYLDKAATAPYGVYFAFSPTIALPSLVFFFNVQSGDFPRTIGFNITVYGTIYELALRRVYTLLHAKVSSFAACTDIRLLQVKYDWSSPDRYDEELKCYYRQDRYLAQGIYI